LKRSGKGTVACVLTRLIGTHNWALSQSLWAMGWYTNLFEVGVRQFEQNFGVDFVFTERRLILTENEAT
jgi:hypothetical protein